MGIEVILCFDVMIHSSFFACEIERSWLDVGKNYLAILNFAIDSMDNVQYISISFASSNLSYPLIYKECHITTYI